MVNGRTKATLSILGLLTWDGTILDSFDTIGAPLAMESQNIKNEIIFQCSQLELMYPDLDFMKAEIQNWIAHRKSEWVKIYNALNAEYNPIHNYDRTEEIEDTEKVTETETSGETGSNSANGTITGANSSFDSADLYTNRKDESAETNSSEVNRTGNRGRDGSRGRNAHIYGNIGVTKTQEMIESEINLRKIDISDIIADEFKYRYCILIY